MNSWNGLTGKDLDVMFKEFHRVLKYGGYCILFGHDNQIAPFQYYAVKNGFEVCQSLYYYYLNNFPKATDVSKSLKKQQNENHIIFDGYKYGRKPLKQNVEIIMVYRKQTKSKNILTDIILSEEDNTISPSILDIENNRVPYLSDKDKKSAIFGSQTDMRGNNYNTNRPSNGNILNKDVLSSEVGRFPSNVLIDEGCSEILDSQNENSLDKISRILHKCSYDDIDNIDLFIYGAKVSPQERDLGLDDICFDDKIEHRTHSKGIGNTIRKCPKHNEPIPSGKSTYKCGCAFVFDKTETYDKPVKIVKNDHPTVKSISMLTKVIKLFILPESCNQKVLIPFSGVNSEVISAVKAGLSPDNITAIEINKRYCDIGNARFEYWTDKWNKDNNK